MENEDPVDCAEKVDERTRWIRYPQRRGAKGLDHSLDGQFRRTWNAGVIRSKRVQPMRIRRRDKWFAKTFCHLDRAPVRIEESSPEVTKLNRVEAVDSFQKLFPHGAGQDVEWMRGDRKQRRTALLT